ncbi:MAG: aminopeptidase P family protein, partial [Deltaproteobacteria bacterium]|nr:aminopeptidase P family protein [Deltaproteobacteria bacterium]
MSSRQATLIIAAPEADSNLYYACRFLAPDPIIYFETGDKKHLVLSDLEIDRAREQADVDKILSLADTLKGLRKQKKSSAPIYTRIVDLIFKAKKIREIVVPANFPAQYFQALKGFGYRMTVKADPFFEARLIKSPEEKKLIRHALKQVETALGETVHFLQTCKIRGKYVYHGREKITSEFLQNQINSRLMELGCVANHTIVASGPQGSLPHHEGSGPILAHTPIIFDIFPRDSRSRYFADMTRTMVKGKASAEVKKMYQAVLEANTRGREMASAGVTGKAVHLAATVCMEKRGFKTGKMNGCMQGFIHSTGHGLGLDIHELPSVSLAGGKLKTGNVITIEPGLYYRKHGGIRIEDVVYVTKNGSEALTKFPRVLEVDRL